jgi:hypothetical protein
MRSRHYLAVECLDPPNTSAWSTLYTSGSDVNFLNVTSLTRYVDLIDVATGSP